MQFAFLRGVGSVVLILLGTALSLFSLPVATGWGRNPLPVAGTITAILGLLLMFAAYWLVRGLDGAPLASGYLKLALGVGSAFLVFGLIAVIIGVDNLPTGYFIATGCLCLFGFVKFRAYRKRVAS